MFAQLNTKTVYTFMDSLIDLRTYILQAKALGYQTLGIMDKDNLYGAYHFIQACLKAQLRPVLGLEVTLVEQDASFNLQMIAKNSRGYKNLLKLSTLRLSDRLSVADVVNYQEGLAFIISANQYQQASAFPLPYYLGVTPKTVVDDYQGPLIALQEVRYFQEEERETLQVLQAIKENISLKDVPLIEQGLELKSCHDMTAAFAATYPEALANLEALVSDIHYEFDQQLKLPRFNMEKPAQQELLELTTQGLQDKKLWTKPYQDRLTNELQVISEMGFDDYFLIVWDLLRFGRSKGYYMGMGRGSAAGSLVAYALDITGIDPVKNNLLFERFLNKERFSMPDIDIDLPDVYRAEFLHYVRNRYGMEHSAQIVTFSTFGPKQAIRDVFKRFGVPEYELTQLTKKIGFKESLASVFESNISFRQVINSKLEYQKAFAIAKRIEGNPRQTSIHAAGIVMSDQLLTDYIPLKRGEDMMITQYDAAAVEANGLLKMDFLGLRNLTFVQRMQEKVAKDYGQELKLEAIDLEDQKTLALFARGDTKGIFQFEQTGAIHLLRRIKPHRFEDVVATTSLNRPGASDYTSNFIKRRNGQEAVDLIDPAVAAILEPTYGIMLYQEQVMQIAQVFAGFTLGHADLLRRAMSKKNVVEMQKMQEAFVQGALQLGHSEQTAHFLFDRMVKFAGYGFNRSHAFAYSALAFQMAYFKAHYPAVFYDVMMNYSNSDYIADALENGFKVGRLSINTIPYHDMFKQDTILLGMKHIKAIPRDLTYWIIEHRPFDSLESFLSALPEHYRVRSILEPLIKVGLFDCFEANRHKMLSNLDGLLIFINELGSLFADSSFSWTETEDYSATEKYQMEQEVIGIGLSDHPLLAIAKRSNKPFQMIGQLSKDQQATLLVQIEFIRIIRTKSSGQQMAFLRVFDTQHKMDVTVFPDTYMQVKDLLKEGGFYYLSGRVKERDQKLQLVLQGIEVVQEKALWILLEDHSNDTAISQLLALHKGNVPVILHYKKTKETLQLSGQGLALTPEVEQALQKLAVKTVYQ
ncbi:DNA polymerase III subunit alpha [Streptococcus halichoeri]|uniref:DNA polymerase III subunit alpha n=1 Tax=Streptococcus halichoeri TaxID=254785 RepID=UPI001C8D7B6A|nr:DNA polymerase III subunit alpha [Streptococcus halichoeri]